MPPNELGPRVRSGEQEPNVEPALTTQSDVIVSYLERVGVEYVFGISGGHIASLHESLHRSEQRGGPRAIMNRHESSAAFMAAGYTLETGKIGVCLVTAGPGVTNVITGAAEANAAHIPMLILSGQTILPPSGRGALQECGPFHGPYPDVIDAVSMMQHCTCYNAMVTHPSQLEHKLAAALLTAHRSLGGVAHLAVPTNILRGPAPEAISFPDLAELVEGAKAESFVDEVALARLQEQVSEVLGRGGRIALFIGYECDGAHEELVRFAELTQAPVVTSWRGKSHINPFHPLFKGVYGIGGHASARAVLEDPSVELILAVGTSLGQMATAAWSPRIFNPKLVHIHHADTFFSRAPMARLHVRGTAARVFQRLNEGLQDRGVHREPYTLAPPSDFPPQVAVQGPEEALADISPIRPDRLMVELQRRLPPDTRYLVDNGTILVWSLHYLFPRSTGAYRLISTSACSMGWAPGSAVGTAMARAGHPVVCLTGDSSYIMYGHEISVAVSERLPVIFIVLNDHCHGAVKHRNREVGTIDLPFAVPPTDFVQLAECVGAQGFLIQEPKDVEELDLDAILAHPGPTVLDVRVDPELAPPKET